MKEKKVNLAPVKNIFRWVWSIILCVIAFIIRIISDMHIYDTFQETLIKTLLFLIAFLVSVLPLFFGYNEVTELHVSEDIAQVNEPTVDDESAEAPFPEYSADSNSVPNSYIATGGALIVYGISLIAEICMLLKPEDFFPKKVIKGAILTIGIAMLAFGFIHIFVPKLTVSPQTIRNFGFISIAIYIWDTITFYFIRPLNKYSRRGQKLELKNIYVEA